MDSLYLEREFMGLGEMLSEYWSVPHHRGEADGTKEIVAMLPPIRVLSPETTVPYAWSILSIGLLRQDLKSSCMNGVESLELLQTCRSSGWSHGPGAGVN